MIRLPLLCVLLFSLGALDATEIIVDKEPRLLRTNLVLADGVILKNSIALGLPGGHNISFDAERCILNAAWKGRFIGPAGDWLGEGDEGSRVLGELTYFNKEHFPIIAPVKGKPKFQGYRLYKGYPTFMYSLGLTKMKVRFLVENNKLVQSFLVVNANYVKYRKAPKQNIKSQDGSKFIGDTIEKTQQPGKLMLIFKFEVGS